MKELQQFGVELLSGGTSEENPLLAKNKVHYFLLFMPALEVVGAERVGSVAREGAIVDVFRSADGRSHFIGYVDVAPDPGDSVLAMANSVVDRLREAGDPESKRKLHLLETAIGEYLTRSQPPASRRVREFQRLRGIVAANAPDAPSKEATLRTLDLLIREDRPANTKEEAEDLQDAIYWDSFAELGRLVPRRKRVGCSLFLGLLALPPALADML